MTKLLARLEITLEILFLASTAVVSVGAAALSPPLRPLAWLLMPLGVSYALVRRGPAVAAAVYLGSLVMIATYPHGLALLPLYTVVMAGVALATGLSNATRLPAGLRLLVTIFGVAAAGWLLTANVWPQVPAFARMITPRALATWREVAGDTSPWHINGTASAWAFLWSLYAVVWGGLVFGILSLASKIYGLRIPILPRFGYWKVSSAALYAYAAAGVALLGLGHGWLRDVLAMQAVWIFILFYVLMGVNDVWFFMETWHMHFGLRAMVFVLLLMAGWLSIAILGAMGLLDGIWRFRELAKQVRRPS